MKILKFVQSLLMPSIQQDTLKFIRHIANDAERKREEEREKPLKKIRAYIFQSYEAKFVFNMKINSILSVVS